MPSLSLFYWAANHRHLHSFPTRRSSDLTTAPSIPCRDRRRTPDKAESRCWSIPRRCRSFAGSQKHCRPPENDRQRSEEHTSELQSRPHLVCRLLLEKKKKQPRCTLPLTP